MKEDVNIEELFKQKFENFEGDVDPSTWANIQQGINSGAAGSGATAGISTIGKIAIIAGAAVVTTVSVWYFSDTEETINNPVDIAEESTQDDNEIIKPEVQKMGESIQVTDTNDPEIQKNIQQIENSLNEQRISEEDIDEELVESIVDENPIEDISVDDSEIDDPKLTNEDNIQEESVNDNNTTNVNSDVDEPTEIEKVYPSGKIEMLMEDVYAPSKVKFKSNARDFTKVEWIFSNGTTLKGENVNITFNKAGTYEVILMVYNEGEVYEEHQEVEVKSKSGIDNIPNVITPNGDRRNDEFSINTTSIKTFYISIRDEKGKEVFTSNDKNFVWDGNDKRGSLVEKGLYTYVIVAEGTDGSVFKIPGQLYVQ